MERPIATLDQSLATSAKLLRVLREAGLTEEALRKPINDRAMRARLVQFWNAQGFNPTTHQEIALLIMKQNFVEIDDVIQLFGVTLTSDETMTLRDIPFTEATLQACKDTHILFPGYPLSIREIRDRVPYGSFKSQDWYYREDFANKEKVGLRWYLIRKDIVKNSMSKTYQAQTALMTANEEVPRACEVVYMAMLYFILYQKHLFEKVYARCSDLSSLDYRVEAGNFGSEGLEVDAWTDDYRDGQRGLAVSQKVSNIAS